MVDDRASPSAGWREVYREMGVDADVEEPIRTCPDCGRECGNVLRDVYECEEHGVFRASAESASPDADSASDGGSPAADGDSANADGNSADANDASADPGESGGTDEAVDRATGRAD